ncbi:MAG: tetratricopeptide repeat protein [Candidatus Omnitrophota bacterium]
MSASRYYTSRCLESRSVTNIKNILLGIFLLTALSVGIYANSLKNSFIWDDKIFVIRDEYMRDIANIPFFFTPRYWKEHDADFREQADEPDKIDYRPLVSVAFCLDYYFWKLNPFGYHLTNLILHILCVIGVYCFVNLLIKESRGREGPPVFNLPFLAAAFFAAHPIHAEAVCWIKNRSELLAMLFILLMCLFFIKSARRGGSASAVMLYLLSALSFIMSLLSKASALAGPLVLAAYVVYFMPPSEKKRGAVMAIPFFAVTALYIILKKIFLEVVFARFEPIGAYTHMLTVIKTLGSYLKMLFLPVGLNAQRYMSFPGSFFEPPVILSAVCLSAALAVMVKTYRDTSGPSFAPGRLRLLSFGLAWTFLTLIPASNIIILFSRPLAEQRLYIPSFGFCVALAAGLTALPGQAFRRLSQGSLRALFVFLVMGILAFYSYSTFSRNQDWKDSVTFWEKAAGTGHNNVIVYNNLGRAYFDSKKYAKAIRCYENAIKLSPTDGKLYNNLASAIYKKYGLVDGVMRNYAKAVELGSDYPEEIYNNVGGIIYAQTGDSKEAERFYYKALEKNANYAPAYYNLGLLSDKAGDHEDAAEYYRKAIKLRPNYALAHNNLGAIYRETGMTDKAVYHFKRAVRFKPAYLKAHRNLASIYCEMGLFRRAVWHLKKILKIDPYDEQAARVLAGIDAPL